MPKSMLNPVLIILSLFGDKCLQHSNNRNESKYFKTMKIRYITLYLQHSNNCHVCKYFKTIKMIYIPIYVYALNIKHKVISSITKPFMEENAFFPKNTN